MTPIRPPTPPLRSDVKHPERPSSAIVSTKDRAILNTTTVQPDSDMCFFAENTERTRKVAPQSAPRNTSPTALEKTRFNRISRSLDLSDVGFNVNGTRRATLNGGGLEKRKGSLNEERGKEEDERRQEELYRVEPADPAWIAIAKR